jgi:ABC-type transport system involved in cytochrome c biogenesis permease subunit
MSKVATPSAARPSGKADAVTIWLWIGIAVVGAGILYLTWFNFTPVLQAAGDKEDQLPPIPEYDYAGWHAVPVQHLARYKPFETACNEVLRQVVGRQKFKGQTAVPIVLNWLFETDPGNAARSSKWDDYAFILCPHETVREVVLGLGDKGELTPVTAEQLHGQYVSPRQLRTFMDRMQKLRQENVEKAEALVKKGGDGLSEAFARLEVYESIRGIEKPRDAVMPNAANLAQPPKDPFMWVAFDKVPGSPWFSMGDLRLLQRDPSAWSSVYMTERVKQALPLYIASSNELNTALGKFQADVKAGTATASLDELRTFLQGERARTASKYLELRKKAEADAKEEAEVQDFLRGIMKTLPQELDKAKDELVQLVIEEQKDKKNNSEAIATALTALLAKRDERVVDNISQQLPARRESYDPTDQAFQMLHLAYMEARFPQIYRMAANAQPLPQDKVTKVLTAYADVARAYRSGNAERFDSASTAFFKTLESESTPPYPGQDGIGDRVHAVLTGAALNPPDRSLLALEQTFNRVVPFQKAWVLMLVSVLFFCLSLGLNSRVCYFIAWGAFAGSLGFQLFGFFVRIIISGRPPVSNMYETVIWVSFMSAIFGGVLELLYRKKVIGLAAAMVSTLGLVLADQMPLALDPKINPLVPVLRSNFWLTIHVLTIVSSYAGGTLAWGLGNVALFLLIFGKNKADTIKLLSQFTYRALQIAVLLLAAGTFLGGWWAAYSWGRFWGWDPKETGALIALVCYVIPLHMRYIGWIRDFGLAVSAIFCYAAILMSWYGVNFVFPAGLHAYALGSGGASWVYWACLINIQWVLVAMLIYHKRLATKAAALPGISISAPVSTLRQSEAIQAPSGVTSGSPA